MGLMTLPFAIGDRAPELVGAAASGRFFSLDGQAGRPALIVGLGGLTPDEAGVLLGRLGAVQAALAADGVDLVPIAPATMPFTERFATDESVADLLIYPRAAEDLVSLSIAGASVTK